MYLDKLPRLGKLFVAAEESGIAGAAIVGQVQSQLPTKVNYQSLLAEILGCRRLSCSCGELLV